MRQLRLLDKNKDLNNLKILLRVDFNVPLQNQLVSDSTKITKVKKIIINLLHRGAIVILCSHLGRPQVKGKAGFSLEPIKIAAEKIIGQEITFINENFKKNIEDQIQRGKKLFLLENLRFDAGEEKDSDYFSKTLADLGELYINEAFSCSHRQHASIHGITKFIDSYAGETINEELIALNSIISDTQRPVACLIGGSKISTKIDLITNLLPKVNYMIIGGAMANNFLKYKNFKVGKSKIEDNIDSTVESILNSAIQNNCELVLPTDVVTAKNFEDKGINKQLNQIEDDDMILDIGNETIKNISNILRKSKTVFWNGPFGFFEKDNFAIGTNQISMVISELTKQRQLISIAGGGDTFAAIKKSKKENDFTYISTAGGAFLEWLEGKILPGLKVLEIKN
jgi:phosphoglycerate kinase